MSFEKSNIRLSTGFSLVELVVVVTILSILTVVGVTYGNNYKLSQYNVRRISDIKTLKNATESYMAATKTLPPALGNRQYYDTKGNYVHDPKTAFGVSTYVTPDTFPREYLQTFPLDPQTNNYYAYGSRLDGTLHYEFATVINDGGEYSTYLRGNYDGTPLASLIKEFNGPNFVDDGTVDYLPYNPEELKVTGHIISWSGSITVSPNNKNPKELLGQGDTVTVSSGGLAQISLSDGSELELGSADSISTLEFNKLKYNEDNNLSSQVEAVLTLGEVWVRAPKYYKTSEFKIAVDGQAATVRGTVFGAKKGATGHNFQLADGQILVTNNNKSPLSISEGSGFANDSTSSGILISAGTGGTGRDLSVTLPTGCTPPAVSYEPSALRSTGMISSVFAGSYNNNSFALSLLSIVPLAFAESFVNIFGAVSTLTCTPTITNSSIHINFTDSSQQEAAYKVIRSKNTIPISGNSRIDIDSSDYVITNLAVDAYNYNDAPSESGTYHYRICREPIGGPIKTWYCSTEQLLTIQALPNPTITLSNTKLNNTIQLSWSISNLPDINNQGYTIYRDDQLLKSTSATTHDYNDINIPVGNHEYKVCVNIHTDAGGTTSACSVPLLVTIDPTLPNNCELTLSGTTATGTLQTKMDTIETQDIGVHSGRIPEILEINKNSTNITLTVQNFGANQIEVSTSGSLIYTGTISSGSGVVSASFDSNSDSSLLLRLCYLPDNLTTFGERRCSAYKQIMLPNSGVPFSFSGASLEQATSEATECGSGSVNWGALGCQDESLLAYAPYDTSGDIFLHSPTGALPISSTKNIISNGVPNSALSELLGKGLRTNEISERIKDFNNNSNYNCAPFSATINTGTFLSPANCYSSPEDSSKNVNALSMNPRTSFFDYGDERSGIFINQSSPSTGGALAYDLSPITDQLGDKFAIEIGVRGAALKRTGGPYFLFTMMNNGILGLRGQLSSAGIIKIGTSAGTISTITLSALGILDDNVYTIRYEQIGTSAKVLILNKGQAIYTSSPMIISGNLTGDIHFGSAYNVSLQQEISQWNDIISSFRIYSLK